MTPKLSKSQRYWLNQLSHMLGPLVWPGPEVVTYKALARRGLATQELGSGGLLPGWVITAAGRALLAAMDATPEAK